MTRLKKLLFCCKKLVRIDSLGWLKSKKEAIFSGDNTFQNALNDALDYQNIETNPQRITKIKPYINKYNWGGIEFPAGQKTEKKLNKMIRQLLLIYYLYHTIQKQ